MILRPGEAGARAGGYRGFEPDQGGFTQDTNRLEFQVGDEEFRPVTRRNGKLVVSLNLQAEGSAGRLLRVRVGGLPVHDVITHAPWLHVSEEAGAPGLQTFCLRIQPERLGGAGDYVAVVGFGGLELSVVLRLQAAPAEPEARSGNSGARFCSKCGASRREACQFCEFCGAPVEDLTLSRPGPATEASSSGAGKTAKRVPKARGPRNFLVVVVLGISAGLIFYPGPPRPDSARAPSPPKPAPANLAIRLDGPTTATVAGIEATPICITRNRLWSLKEGPYNLTVSSEGYEPASRATELKAGQTIKETFKLRVKSFPLTIATTPPGATVTMDGKLIGTTPCNTALSWGDHRVSFRLPHYTEETQQLKIKGATPVNATLHYKEGLLKLVSDQAGQFARIVSKKKSEQRFDLVRSNGKFAVEVWLAPDTYTVAVDHKDGFLDRKPDVVTLKSGEGSVPVNITLRPVATQYVNSKDGSVLLSVPAGEFFMGASPKDNDPESGEKPGRQVRLAAYQISKYEVTNAQYAQFVKSTGYAADTSWLDAASTCSQRAPVAYVSWDDAQAYCKWAGLRLPSEAEWERAARGSDGRIYPWGNNWDSSKSVSGTTAPQEVGTKPTDISPARCLDMAGNVGEWVSDWYEPERENNMYRGGSWTYSNPSYFRCSERNSVDIHDVRDFGRRSNLGFRCARTP